MLYVFKTHYLSGRLVLNMAFSVYKHFHNRAWYLVEFGLVLQTHTHTQSGIVSNVNIIFIPFCE